MNMLYVLPWLSFELIMYIGVYGCKHNELTMYMSTCMHAYIHTCRPQARRETGRQANRQTVTQADMRHTDKHAFIHSIPNHFISVHVLSFPHILSYVHALLSCPDIPHIPDIPPSCSIHLSIHPCIHAYRDTEKQAHMDLCITYLYIQYDHIQK